MVFSGTNAFLRQNNYKAKEGRLQAIQDNDLILNLGAKGRKTATQETAGVFPASRYCISRTLGI